MKRVLTATTAIVGMSVAASSVQAAEPIDIGLSGFMNAYYGFGDRDTDDGQDTNVTSFQDATINFSGSTTLDNGIEVGARFELESFGHPQDEQYIYFDGSFGNIKAGSHNSVIYQMGWVASGHTYAAGAPVNSGWIATLTNGFGTDSEANFRQPSLSTYITLHNDANTVSYQTPRFAGFKFGASFTPNASNTGAAQFNTGDENTIEHNAFSLAANFSREFGNVTVNAAGGWERSNEAENNGDEEADAFSGHVNVAVAGFSLGGGVAVLDSENFTGSDNNQAVRNDGFSWDVGATYSTGPWTAQVNFLKSEVEGGPGPGEDENRFIQGAIDYALGPGITVSASVLNSEWDGGDPGDTEVSGTFGVLGTTVTF